MGMNKDINNLFKEFMGCIHVLQKGYHKSKIKEKASKGNQKLNDYFNKIITWIKKELKK